MWWRWLAEVQTEHRNGEERGFKAHQNWTIEDWRNVDWSDESRFLLRNSDVGSEFDVKNMKTWIHPAFLNGSGWWWCNGVGGIFLAHLHTTVYPVADWPSGAPQVFSVSRCTMWAGVPTKHATYQIVLQKIYLYYFKGKFRVRVGVDE